MKHGKSDQELGMGRRITRRDFLNGFGVAVGASFLSPHADWLETFGLPQSPFAPEKNPDYYPPALTGMRGSHEGSFEVAHALRDGRRWSDAAPDAESYDLIVVGGGISGLTAAYLFRKMAGPKARVLILDNHDDFGGHAKRNEFRAAGRTIIGYGGAQSIASPKLYSKQAMGLLVELGVDVRRFDKYFDRNFEKRMGLDHGVFFDKETFGEDRLVAGTGKPTWPEFFARTPLSLEVQKDLARLYTDKVDYLPGMSSLEKKVLLARTSYQDFLLKYVKLRSDSLPALHRLTYGIYAVGIDSVPAGDLPLQGYPGFKGMNLSGPPGPGLGVDVTGQDPSDPYICHFPDGNASVARLLVRALIPRSAPGHTMEDIVTAKMNYALLDDAASPVRIRLNSTVVGARNVGASDSAEEVEVSYVRGGEPRSVRGKTCILACWNMIIPYLCPEMPQKQKDALAYGVKTPLVIANVLIGSWQPVKKLGVSETFCPGSYFEQVNLEYPVSMGDYHFPKSPNEPWVLHLERTPCRTGKTARDQQIAGRRELFATPFVVFERNIRSQLGRMFSPGGFDPARDVLAITVNRWPHGYAYEYNSLYDPDWPADQQPCVIGRQLFGRISIANADAAAFSYMNAAIDQAFRAVGEVARFSAKGSS